jgi:hypothetical protein
MPTTIWELLEISGLIAIGFLFAVAFYESLSTRDVLVARATRFARRVSKRRWFAAMVYLLIVFVGVPLLVLVWTVILEIGLFFVGSVDRLANTAFVAVAVVGAARILSYIREKTSHELAKAIPLSFAFLFLTGGTLNLEAKVQQLAERPEGIALTDTMIIFLIGLEISLRLLTDGSHAALATMRRRRGIESDLGVWRTLRATLGGAPGRDGP